MIGIIASKNEGEAVREFFELFKTPWEFYQESQTYDVVIITRDIGFEVDTKLLIVYGSKENLFDRRNNLKLLGVKESAILQYRDIVFPIYGNVNPFPENNRAAIRITETNDVVAVLFNTDHSKVIRIGFDLFQEVEYLLCNGQLLHHAQVPTLDIHITMIRDWIVGAGIPLVEVPNHPASFDFTVCLTHDVDFFRICDHKFDHTMWGFLYRSLCCSFLNFLQRKISLVKLLKNWRAACLLPGVYLGVVKDYFLQFDRYLEVEKELISTFFIVPFKNKPGVDDAGQRRSSRAVRYDINDIKPEVEKLLAAGREIALHGIDAWHDTSKGQEELQRIASITGNDRLGIRTHWLYQNEQSPQHLEEAGFVYDSTLGYNETVGYRSGTTQIFRPLGVKQLLELPLNIMDTALFSSGRMGLAESQAMTLVEGIIANTRQFGGVLTINWHHRSMGPERLWDNFYENMLSHLKRMRVWFATAHQAVWWFRTRRSVCFHAVHSQAGGLQVRLSSIPANGPQLLLRVHIPRGSGDETYGWLEGEGRIIDVPFSGDLNMSISIQNLEKI